jgi:dTDP-glucose 4,6-dehydratase
LLVHCDRSLIVGEVINLGYGTSVSLAEIAPLIVRLMAKSESLITYVGDRPGQVFRHTADASKAERLLGWRPQIAFEEGLRRTISWYTENRAWWSKQLWMREIPIITKTGRRELH